MNTLVIKREKGLGWAVFYKFVFCHLHVEINPFGKTASF